MTLAEGAAAAGRTDARAAPAARVQCVDSLRGIAAFSVMAYHFTMYGSLFDRSTPVHAALASVTHYGNLGVPVFFVISGFVLPYSLSSSRYGIADAPRFIGKRLVRLEPTYLFSIALALGLWWAAARTKAFNGPPFEIEPARFFPHFAYLSDLTGHEWYVRNYWTLGMEFQFYLAIAVLFPLIDRPNPWIRSIVVSALILADFFDAPSALFASWGGLFALGILVFFARDRSRRRPIDYVLAVICIAELYRDRGAPLASAATATAVAIYFDKFPRLRPVVFLGAISYSLYLFHGIVGQKVVNLGGRVAGNDVERIGIMAVAMAVTIAFSWAVFRLVESPSQRLSSSIRYRSRAPE